MFPAAKDVAGFSSTIGPGSAFHEMMRGSQRSVAETVKSLTASIQPLAGQPLWSSGVLGGSSPAMAALIKDVAGFSSTIGPGSAFHEMMRGSQRSVAETLSKLMQSWSVLAERGNWTARFALRMALAARDAVKRSDLDAVKRFMVRWLGFTRESITFDPLNSASLVLLEISAWLPEGLLPMDFDPTLKIRALTLAEHRHCNRLITDPALQANGKPVLSLNQMVSTSDSEYTLFDTLAAKPDANLTSDVGDAMNEIGPDVVEALGYVLSAHERDSESA